MIRRRDSSTLDTGSLSGYYRPMASHARSIALGEFESKTASLLDEVAATGETLVVTREGKPLAKVVPFEKPRPLLGSVLWEKDIVSPLDETWDAES